jgi:hypothetical protein
MKNWLWFGFLLLAQAAFGQSLKIDSLRVIESKGELVIHGAFGTTPGNVYIDSLSNAVISWTDSNIVATIPDTGKGSAGLVQVESQLNFSNSRMLSRWRGSRKYSDVTTHPSGNDGATTVFVFSERGDVLSALEQGPNAALALELQRGSSLTAMNSSHTEDTKLGSRVDYTMNSTVDVQDTTGYSQGFVCSPSIDCQSPLLFFWLTGCRGFQGTMAWLTQNRDTSATYTTSVNDFSVSIALDSFLEIKKSHTLHTYPYEYTEETIDGSMDFPPPATAVLLNYPPVLLTPHADSVMTDSLVILRWTGPGQLDSFEVQIGTDSSLTHLITDTIVVRPDSMFMQQLNVGRYFWRVRSLADGETGKWSAVWRFQVRPVTNSVAAGNRIQGPQMDANGMIHDVPTGEACSLSFYDMIGRMVGRYVVQSNSGECHVPLQTLRIAAGVYAVSLKAGNTVTMHKVVIR